MQIDYSPQATVARDVLLSKIKAQYEPGPMRPRLYDVLEQGGKKQSPLKTQWMAYAGMGDVMLYDLSPADQKAVAELRAMGRVVPTVDASVVPSERLRLLQHFDDVCWGRRGNGTYVIFELASNPAYPDALIEMDEGLAPALMELQKRITYGKTMEDAPILVRGRTTSETVAPILTDASVISLRQRQLSFNP